MEELTFKFALFGGEIKVIVYSPNKDIENIMSDFYKEAFRLQKIFNFFDNESELSQLNRKREMQVSKELGEVIKSSLKFSRLTSGKYDITLGKKIIQRKSKKIVEKVSSSFKNIKILSDKIELTHKDALIDLGSIAKGHITDRLSDFLKSNKIDNFLIDSRGDIIASGSPNYIIEIQHPRDQTKLMSVILKNQGIATSGDYKQFHGTFDKSHIINSNNLISVSVIASTLEEADVYATAIFVSSEKEIQNMIRDNKNIKVLTIDKNLNQKMYNNFRSIVYE